MQDLGGGYCNSETERAIEGQRNRRRSQSFQYYPSFAADLRELEDERKIPRLLIDPHHASCLKLVGISFRAER